LDIDGVNNTFVQEKLVKQELINHPYNRKSIWKKVEQPAYTEKSAQLIPSVTEFAVWKMQSQTKTSKGYYTGYKILPSGAAVSLLDPADPPQRKAAFSENTLWVTKFSEDELFAGGMYPNQGQGSDGLKYWTNADRSINNTDVVVWYTLGTHHIPCQEDWPVMPTKYLHFDVVPYNFFESSPLLDL